MYPPRLFLEQVIRPTLDALSVAEPRAASVAAEQLLMGTALAESGLAAVRQRGGGPALGYFQIEPRTFRDVAERYLPQRRSDLLAAVAKLAVPVGARPLDQLPLNPWLGCAIARLRYWMDREPLAAAGDWGGHAETWKRVYNTERGAQTVEHFRAAAAAAEGLWEA